MRARLSVFLATCLLALPAQALVLPPLPEGTCPIDTRQTADRNATTYMRLTTQAPGTLKALFAECAELERLRSGRVAYITNYGAIFEQTDPLPTSLSPADGMAVLKAAAGLSGTIATKAVNAAAMANNTATRDSGPLRTASFHSILGQSDRVLVLGGEQRHLGNRLQYGVAAVTALAIVKGRAVAMNFYAPLQNDETYGKVARVAESYANSLIAANP